MTEAETVAGKLLCSCKLVDLALKRVSELARRKDIGSDPNLLRIAEANLMTAQALLLTVLKHQREGN